MAFPVLAARVRGRASTTSVRFKRTARLDAARRSARDAYGRFWLRAATERVECLQSFMVLVAPDGAVAGLFFAVITVVGNPLAGDLVRVGLVWARLVLAMAAASVATLDVGAFVAHNARYRQSRFAPRSRGHAVGNRRPTSTDDYRLWVSSRRSIVLGLPVSFTVAT